MAKTSLTDSDEEAIVNFVKVHNSSLTRTKQGRIVSSKALPSNTNSLPRSARHGLSSKGYNMASSVQIQTDHTRTGTRSMTGFTLPGHAGRWASESPGVQDTTEKIQCQCRFCADIARSSTDTGNKYSETHQPPIASTARTSIVSQLSSMTNRY